MELPEVQHLEDPQNRDDRPAVRPVRMAVRNSVAALVGIFAVGAGLWFEAWLHGNTPIDFRIWGAIAAFSVVICVTHAILAARFGGRRAGEFLKFVVVAAIAGMLFAVWYSLEGDAPVPAGVFLATFLIGCGWFFRPRPAAGDQQPGRLRDEFKK